QPPPQRGRCARRGGGNADPGQRTRHRYPQQGVGSTAAAAGRGLGGRLLGGSLRALVVCALVAHHGGVVGGERGRELVAPVAAGDEVEIVDGGGVEGRFECVVAGVGDRSGGEAADRVGVVRRLAGEGGTRGGAGGVRSAGADRWI